MIWGDFHIHTSFSGKCGHAKGDAPQILDVAKKIGLKQVGIADHGLRHCCFATNMRRLVCLRKQIDALNESQQDVKMLLGIESNIFCSDGLVDLRKIDRSIFDYVVAGYHKLVWSKNLVDCFNFSLPALFNAKKIKNVNTFTKAYINAIKTQKIDILAHPCYGLPIDIKEVGKAAADYGVLIELNGKRISMSNEQILTLCDCGVNFVLDSDAHSPQRVGEVQLPLSVVERLDIDRKKIANWQKLVEFKK